jgi:hypothetical protein
MKTVMNTRLWFLVVIAIASGAEWSDFLPNFRERGARGADTPRAP